VKNCLSAAGFEKGHPRPEEVQAILAPEIPDSEGERRAKSQRKRPCPICGDQSQATGARVTFIEDTALLESIGGVGGFLRWRE